MRCWPRNWTERTWCAYDSSGSDHGLFCFPVLPPRVESPIHPSTCANKPAVSAMIKNRTLGGKEIQVIGKNDQPTKRPWNGMSLFCKGVSVSGAKGIRWFSRCRMAGDGHIERKLAILVVSDGGFLKWWYPKNTPKWSFLVGNTLVVGCHHFRKHPDILGSVVATQIFFMFTPIHGQVLWREPHFTFTISTVRVLFRQLPLLSAPEACYTKKQVVLTTSGPSKGWRVGRDM